jgi:hypothetical protein
MSQDLYIRTGSIERFELDEHHMHMKCDFRYVSDSYYSIAELYAQSDLLFIALANQMVEAQLMQKKADPSYRISPVGFKAWKLNNGEPCVEGTFLAVLKLGGETITFALNGKVWANLDLPHYDRLPEILEPISAEELLKRLTRALKLNLDPIDVKMLTPA